MIEEALRQAARTRVPAGAPALTLAGGDGSAALATLPAAAADVFVEGLEELDDPATFLVRLRAAAPQARLLALVANAAHVRALDAFYGGGPLAGGHPLVLAEIAPLLQSAGWQPLSIEAMLDLALPPAGAAPIEVRGKDMSFALTSSATLERARTAAYLVLAEAR